MKQVTDRYAAIGRSDCTKKQSLETSRNVSLDDHIQRQ